MELAIGYNLWFMLTIWHVIVREDPNVEDDFGMTALHCSAKKGDRKAVSLLARAHSVHVYPMSRECFYLLNWFVICSVMPLFVCRSLRCFWPTALESVHVQKTGKAAAESVSFAQGCCGLLTT